MLPQRSRIPRELYTELLKSSKYSQSDSFTLRYKLEGTSPRFGVSVSKKISKKAVDRNTIRRRTYSALSPLIASLPGGLFVLVAKPESKTLRGEKLESELKKLFSKALSLSL